MSRLIASGLPGNATPVRLQTSLKLPIVGKFRTSAISQLNSAIRAQSDVVLERRAMLGENDSDNSDADYSDFDDEINSDDSREDQNVNSSDFTSASDYQLDSDLATTPETLSYSSTSLMRP